jgi:hypothetical protein
MSTGDGFLKGLLVFAGVMFTGIYVIAHANGAATSGTVVYLFVGLFWFAFAGWLAYLGRHRA